MYPRSSFALEFRSVGYRYPMEYRNMVTRKVNQRYVHLRLSSSTLLLAFFAAALTLHLQETVFQCMQSWVRYVNVPADEVVRNPLLPAAFDALENRALFETAVDFLVEVRRDSEESVLELYSSPGVHDGTSDSSVTQCTAWILLASLGQSKWVRAYEAILLGSDAWLP